MTTHFIPFEQCSPQQLADAFALRQRVFVIEQACFYEDIDGHDPKALHLFIYDGKVLSAYLRYFEPGVKYAEPSLGRIVVEKAYRGGTLGKKLIQTGIDHSFRLHPKNSIKIEAQAALTNYYTQFGFTAISEVYLVDGIEHIQMLLTP